VIPFFLLVAIFGEKGEDCSYRFLTLSALSNGLIFVLVLLVYVAGGQPVGEVGLTLLMVAFGVNGSSIATAANPVPIGGIDSSSTARPVLTSAAGNVQVSSAKGTSYSSAALEISRVVSASACLVSKIRVQNINGATRYVHIFNAASLPGNGTVPTVMFTLTANSGGEVVFQIPTDRFSTGLVVAASSTQGTLTISATADFLIFVDLFPANA
jgi:hypothetical protein